jgi:DNA polymerase III epsilon subunit-like protein
LILLSLDFETTGLNVVEDRVIEVGAVLYSTGQHKCLDSIGSLVKTDKEITPYITGITNCHPVAVREYGYEPSDVLPIITGMMDSADYMMGYNCRRFDFYLLYHWMHREGITMPQKLWIDIYADLPWQVPTGKLSHTAADHGILNLFPHSALADCQTTLAIANKYDPQLLVDRARSPLVILRSHAERTATNSEVKQWKFRWNASRKWWWKAVKEQDVDDVVKTVPFNVSIEKDATFEELDN